ncbi:DUF6956 domain-containing protein [Bacteroides fragilis]|uniref:DUF6956 domain-containing protein n=1 Tax=Bacteroides fragilis TaxID=817 RepID=UPI003D9A0A10
MTVVFGEPISQIDRSVFEDVATWGVCSLQGWVNSYESVRFVAIDDHTAIITGESNITWNRKSVVRKVCAYKEHYNQLIERWCIKTETTYHIAVGADSYLEF